MYFPAVSDTSWERIPLANVGWKEAGIQPLKEYLIQKNTKSFMILINGRIVMEEYFNGHTPTSTWAWNSAGKTLVTAITGIAQQENYLQINNKVSDYLGVGWTSEPQVKENLITVKNLLTMTTGINDASELTTVSNLTYLADAGTRWSYSNVFQKLMDVAAAASKQSFEDFFSAKLKNRVGMEGYWRNGIIYRIYHSNTRSMARFGLLALNRGKWKTDRIVNQDFFTESINTSQSINPAYGYLWWLNGKTTYMAPGSQLKFPGPLVPEAPSDMYTAMGADEQRIYVVPSKNMVVIRMGEGADAGAVNLAISGFDNTLWQKINAVIK
jgi:CubicO group peptidase (beta-lactamase class C family)